MLLMMAVSAHVVSRISAWQICPWSQSFFELKYFVDTHGSLRWLHMTSLVCLLLSWGFCCALSPRNQLSKNVQPAQVLRNRTDDTEWRFKKLTHNAWSFRLWHFRLDVRLWLSGSSWSKIWSNASVWIHRIILLPWHQPKLNRIRARMRQWSLESLAPTVCCL